MPDRDGSPVTLENGRELQCVMCGHDRFRVDRLRIETTWWRRVANSYSCVQCQYMHLFRD